MKTRILPMFTAWIIMLSACDMQQPVTTSTPDPSLTQPPQVTLEVTLEVTPQVSSPEPSIQHSFEVILPNGLLPPVEYKSPSTPPRRYEEITQTLIPQPDYGRIWPYIGGFATQMWMLGELYGLCDEAGQIICDPVYNQVQILEKDGNQLYMLTKNQADKDWRNISKVTLANLDGSWVKEYDDVIYESNSYETGGNQIYNWRQIVIYDYITVCENGKWGTIDYEGNEILPCSYSAPVYFSEGLAAVLSDDEKTYRFIDKTGSNVLGPYTTPPQQIDPFDYSGKDLVSLNLGILFCEGFARIFENNKYGIIDRAGRVIIPAQYDFISSYRNGMAQFVTGGLTGILDANGKVLLEPTESWFSQNEDGEIILEKRFGSVAIDLVTGEETPNRNTDRLMWSSSTNGVTIKLDDGDLSFPDANNVVELENGNFALSNRDNTWQIINRSGEMVAGPFDGRAESYWNSFIHVYDGISNLNYGYEARYQTLYDQTGKRVLPDKYREITPFGSRYLARQDYCSGLVDENGNWVIKVWLYDYIVD